MRASHGTFHCFGCAEHGDAIAFLQKIEVIGFVEAVERLADRVGVQLTYEGGGRATSATGAPSTRLLEANRSAAEFYAAQLRTPEAAPAMAFLTARGFDAAAAQRFGCGYAPAGWDTLTKHLLASGFSFEELEKAGLSRQGNRGPMDRFHRRLLWPIRDRGGEVVGFGARRLYDDDRIEAKYLNTAESPVYRKTHVLFGLDLAKSRDRQATAGSGRRGLHRRHGDAPRGRADGGRRVRHRVRRRAHRRDPTADRRRLVRPLRGHLHLRRRRGGPGGSAQSVRQRGRVRHPDLRHDRPRRAGSVRAAPAPGRCGRSRSRGPARADLRVRHPGRAARARPRHGRGPGRRPAAHGAAGGPHQAARTCATSTPAVLQAG